MRKTVLIVIDSLGIGGAEKSLVSLLPLIDYEKYQIDLLIHYIEKRELDNFLDRRINILPNLPFVEFCNRRGLKKVFSGNLKFIYAKIKWGLALRRKKNKLRHPTEIYWENCKIAFKSQPKTYDVAVAWGQGTATHYVVDKVNAKKKYAWINADYELVKHDKVFDNRYYQNVDKIIAVSDKLCHQIKTVFPQYRDKIKTIYDIVNYNIMQEMAYAEEVLMAEKRPIIITIGRLVPPKGYPLAIEACSILKDRGLDFAWYIIGDGEEKEKLQKMIRNKGLEDTLYLLGAKRNPYAYLRKADLYVQTSISEGYCLTLAEARILNKPIVSTNFEIVYDQLKDGENGLIVEMSPESIAEGIVRVLGDYALREKFVNNLMKEKKGNEEEAIKFMELLDS